MANDLWVVGDVQGFLETLQRVLAVCGLVDARDHWRGGSATLAILGDLVDRGPDGIGVIEFLMRLQTDAARHGGQVQVLIGNHDVLLLAAHKFGSVTRTVTGRTILEDWRLSGGVASDLERLTATHVRWIEDLPAMWLERGILMTHADALFYLDYGATVEDVNARFAAILHSSDFGSWDRLLEDFSEHRAFLGHSGCDALERMLATFGGERLVHGHTPIPRVTRQVSTTVTGAYVYCDGRCMNVDPGIYLGGPGFAYNVPYGRVQSQ